MKTKLLDLPVQQPNAMMLVTLPPLMDIFVIFATRTALTTIQPPTGEKK